MLKQCSQNTTLNYLFIKNSMRKKLYVEMIISVRQDQFDFFTELAKENKEPRNHFIRVALDKFIKNKK